MVIDALKTKYQLDELLETTGMAKSSYFYQRKAQSQPDKYLALRTKIREIFIENRCCYGYRRIHAVLKNKGITCSEKVIRRIMSEDQLNIHGKKKRRYNSYLGEISPAVPNLLARDFHADKPNEKWVTDLTEFQIPAGKVYLSPILDCFDGLVVSWSIGTSPDAELVNSMLDEGAACLSEDEHHNMIIEYKNCVSKDDIIKVVGHIKEECLVDVQIGGYVKSPYEERIALITCEIRRGWEGPPHEVEFGVV